MKIYSIADLHMDDKKEKPMDIFGDNWKNHEEKIIQSWKETINDDDLILIPGDISWAIKLDGAYEDLIKIDQLKGIKVIIRGNHDYWWSSKTQLNKLGLDSIRFIINDCYESDTIGVYGTRGWISRDERNFTEKDEKIFKRELLRLENSLKSSRLQVGTKIVMIHFPPFNNDGSVNEFVELMIKYDIDICLYGHLHGEGHNFIKESIIEGIRFHCVSSDYLNFKLKEIY